MHVGIERLKSYEQLREAAHPVLGRITFVTWKWQQANFRHTYTQDHVNVMGDMIRRHTRGLDARVVCVTDNPDHIDQGVECYPLWKDHSGLLNASGQHLPSCYRRLKLFDVATQRSLGIGPGERVVSIDLDAVILSDLRPLLERNKMFVGWGVPGARHDKVFNGSMWMLRSNDELQWMWDCFRPVESPAAAREAGFFGSDQGYISHQLAYSRDCGSWTEQDGVLSYPNTVRPLRNLPPHSRVVFFHGKRKPWEAMTKLESKWITKYWRRGP